MELSKLFEMQRQLDQRITHDKGLHGQDLLPKKILALQVELGELANEWRGFKFWSKDQRPRVTNEIAAVAGDVRTPVVEHTKNPMLEEYVDCLHFIMSIGLEVDAEIDQQLLLQRHRYSSDITEYFNLLFGAWNGIDTREDNYEYYLWTLEVFLELGEMLGFTWEQISMAYFEKNKVNHERQATGY